MIFGQKRLLNNIPELKALAEIHPLAGFSCGNKYYAKTKAGQDVILILGDTSAQYCMKEEMRWINYLESCGMPTNRLLILERITLGKDIICCCPGFQEWTFKSWFVMNRLSFAIL